MILRCKAALANTKGSAVPLTVAITLALLLLFTGISEYFRLMLIAQGVRDTLQTAVIAVVNDNYDDVYHSVREGYSGAYRPVAETFEESLDYSDIYALMDDTLGLTYDNGYYVQYTSQGEVEYRLWGLDVDIENAPISSGDIASQRFVVDSTLKLEVPVSFGGTLLPSMTITLKTSAGYTPRF
ncbi:hypothetical protein RFF05_17930 [Bengtsoniella intestinalis]|uniref:hypothetical protein n=1 Tax=Bengtsoniella intestinalis TaxID=3073143 RepID=UPI00391F08A4